MAKMIVSAVSNLTAPSDKPTLKPSFAVSPTENMMEGSKDKAPVLLRIPYTETTDGKAFAREVAMDSEIGVEEAALYLNVLGELVEKLAKDAKNFHFGLGRADLSISGSLSAGDEVADADRHQLQYTVVPTDEVKRTFAAIECRVPAESVPAAIRRIRDKASGDGYIAGHFPFYVQGNGLTCAAPGEKLELYSEDKTTVLATAEIVSTSPEISIEAKFADTPEPGRYFLKLTTLAGGKDTLYPIGIYVTVIEAPVPPELKIVKVHSTKLAADDTVSLFNDDSLIEVNQPLPADSTAFVRLVKIATGQVLGTLAHRDGCTSTMIDEKTIKVHLAGNTSEAPDGSWSNMEGKRVEVIVKTPTDSCVREVTPVISEE